MTQLTPKDALKLRRALGGLQTAIVQSLPSDDQIIMDHVREAERILTDVLQESWHLEEGRVSK